jgi:hypothetical protein
MKARIGRLWRLGRGRLAKVGRTGTPDGFVPEHDATDVSSAGGNGAAGDLALPEGSLALTPPPEQPVLLMPSGDARPVKVGELLPARRRRWPLSVVRLPAVPKRTILAVGVCAGLAAPGLARHLATRLLLGPPAARGEGVLEITRIVYNGPLTPRAAAAISKALMAARR